jgi:poly-gamma-glutamate capsule biosynthesis protein CapA/YwtB (metallophosphatase superfamily)
MNEPTIEDIAAMRTDGSLREYFQYLTSQAAKPAPTPKPALAAVAPPAYEIAHRGGWPIGTTATGPTPTHGRCTCPQCEQAAVVALPTVGRQHGQAA